MAGKGRAVYGCALSTAIDADHAGLDRIAQHQRNLHDVERDLATPEIAKLTGDEHPEVDAARAAQREALSSAEAARAAGVEMPISEAVAALLAGAPLNDTVAALLARPLKPE